MKVRKMKRLLCLTLSAITVIGEAGNVTTMAAETSTDNVMESVDDTEVLEQSTEEDVVETTEESIENTEELETTKDSSGWTIPSNPIKPSEPSNPSNPSNPTTPSNPSTPSDSTTVKVTGLKQTSDTTQSVKVEWNATGKLYTVEWSSDNVKWTSAGVTQQTSSTINNLTAGKKYYVRVYANADTKTAATVEVYTKPSVKPASISQINDKTSTTSTTIQWDKVNGATGYKVEYKPNINSATKVTKYVTTNKIKLTDMLENTKYFVYVYAYVGNDTYKAVSKSKTSLDVKLKPTKVSGLRCDTFYTKKGACLKVDQINNVNGYHWVVYKYNGSSKKYDKKVDEGKCSNSTILTTDKVKVGQFYMVKVRAYTTINNKNVYGKWSNVTYVSGDPKEITVKNASSSQKVSWSTVKRATSYTVYVSTNKNSRGKKVGTTNKTNITCKKYGKNKLKKGTKYYYTIVANMKVGDKTYKSTPYFRYGKTK